MKKPCFDCVVTDFVIGELDRIIEDIRLSKENVFSINKINREGLTKEQTNALAYCPKCKGNLKEEGRDRKCLSCGYVMPYKQIIKILVGRK